MTFRNAFRARRDPMLRAAAEASRSVAAQAAQRTTPPSTAERLAHADVHTAERTLAEARARLERARGRR